MWIFWFEKMLSDNKDKIPNAKDSWRKSIFFNVPDNRQITDYFKRRAKHEMNIRLLT